MTEINVDDYILVQNEELKATHKIYQNFLFTIQIKNKSLLKQLKK